MKDKIAISMDGKLRARIDAIAKETVESRSQVIERLCEERLETDYVEFVRLKALPTQIRQFVKGWVIRGEDEEADSFVVHDDDGPVEMVLRAPRREWEQAMKKSQDRMKKERKK